MVDSRTSHCFINQATIDKLGLQISSTGEIGVRLGDGSRFVSGGVCWAMRIGLGPTQIIVDC